MRSLHALAAVLALAALPPAALANDAHRAPARAGGEAKAAAFTEGEVRKVDLEQGKVTLKHGPIDNLGMTPMTMVFRVADASALPRLKVGDKVKFKADKVNGAYTVTEIAPAQ